MFNEAAVVLSISGLLAVAVLILRFFKPKFPAKLSFRLGEESGEHATAKPSTEQILREQVERSLAAQLQASERQTAMLQTLLVQMLSSTRNTDENKEWRNAFLQAFEQANKSVTDASVLVASQAEAMLNRVLAHAEDRARLEADLEDAALQAEIKAEEGRIALETSKHTREASLAASLASLVVPLLAPRTAPPSSESCGEGVECFCNDAQGMGEFAMAFSPIACPLPPPRPFVRPFVRPSPFGPLSGSPESDGYIPCSPEQARDEMASVRPVSSIFVERMVNLEKDAERLASLSDECKKGKDKDKGKDKPAPAPAPKPAQDEKPAASTPASSPSPDARSAEQAFHRAYNAPSK